MNKYLRLFLLWLLGLLMVTLAAYFVDNIFEIESLSLNTISEVVTVSTSLATFIIAVLLYRRFSGSQALVDEQTKKVMDLIGYISSIRIHVFKFENGQSVGGSFNILVFNYRHRDKDESIFSKPGGKKFKQYADPNLIDMTWGLRNFMSELYLPKKIAEKIKQDFSVSSWSSEQQSDLPSSYIKISVVGAFEHAETVVLDDDDRESPRLVAKIDKKTFDIEDLLIKIEAVYEESLKWLSKNNLDVYASLNLSKTNKSDFF